MAELEYRWPYRNPEGVVIGEIRRYRNEDGSKDDIPYCSRQQEGQAFKKGISMELRQKPYPLFGCDSVRPGAPVIIVEGQKVQAALSYLKLPAVTSILGSKAFGKSDWSILEKCKKIVIAPDNDVPGRDYAKGVISTLARYVTADKLCLVDIPDLPEKGDLVDWLQAQPELDGWNGLEPLDRYPNKLEVRSRLIKTLESSVTDLPQEWLKPDVFTGWMCDPPRPLQRRLDPSPPYPVAALGDVLSSAVRVIIEATQAPPAIAGQSVLAAAALGVQAHGNIVLEGRTIPTSLFLVTIAASGERKSTVDNFALAPHRKFRKKLTSNYKVDNLVYQNKKDAYAKARAQATQEAKGKSVEETTAALEALGDPPVPPPEPVIVCEEPTYEALVKLYVTGRPSLGIFSDEGGRFVSGHAMNQENILKTVAGLSKLWDGAAIDRVRAGEGTAVLFGKRLSMHLMMQPVVAPMLLSNDLLLSQGFASRLLVSYPASTAGSRFYRNSDPTETREFRTYFSRMMHVLEEPLPLEPGTNELVPKQLQLAPSAKESWVIFHDEIETELGDEGRYGGIRGFASKAAEQALRIAGILSLFDDLQNEIISAYYVEQGIELMRYYLKEALRVFSVGIIDPELARAQKLLDWMRAQKRQVFYLSEIYQYGPSSIRNSQMARLALETLFEHGWIKPGPGDQSGGDRRKREVWELKEGEFDE